jgi:hypothetical protein
MFVGASIAVCALPVGCQVTTCAWVFVVVVVVVVVAVVVARA